MIKRDTIQRVVLQPSADEMGGSLTTPEPKEIVIAHVSVQATNEQITQYGPISQLIINVVSNIKLDEYVNTRYIYSGKPYKLMRQVKRGNEYFSVLQETNE